MKNWKAVYCSTSIANFKDKLARKFGLPEWHFLKSMWKPAVFFGMYNPVDYFRFIWHRGSRTVFWCGGDILNLQKRKFWQIIFRHINAYHVCENYIESEALLNMGIIPNDIRPSLLDRIDDTEITYKHSDNLHVYLCAHEGRESEYGVYLIEEIAPMFPHIMFHIYGIGECKCICHPYDVDKDHYISYVNCPWCDSGYHGSMLKNVIYHGKVSPAQFNQDIKHYHAAIRLNEFDGFSEILARSILLGQWPITRIAYPHMTWVQNKADLIEALKFLSTKTSPNYVGAEYWREKLSE